MAATTSPLVHWGGGGGGLEVEARAILISTYASHTDVRGPFMVGGYLCVIGL